MNQSDLLISMGYGCGTNPVCDDPRPFMLITGCVDCGHTLGEHGNRKHGRLAEFVHDKQERSKQEAS